MKIPTLSVGEFPEFFELTHGYRPFPWQMRLLQEVEKERKWPDLLDLPTGTGKTAVIDIAVFLLALEAHKQGERSASMRIVFVVDRRLVVDEAFARAIKIKNHLHKAQEGTVSWRVGRRLCHLAGQNGAPLEIARLRGGVPLESDWARTPCQPTILCSTVDQVGSRLLFRGYGVSDRMKPVHAGLLGTDSLIILDEAHLSEPFRQTVDAVPNKSVVTRLPCRPVRVALMTATPAVKNCNRWTFTLGPEDFEHSVLKRRLSASKPVRLAINRNSRAQFFGEQALAMVKLLREAGVEHPAVAVIVNRVSVARSVFEYIRNVVDRSEAFKTCLVIGRSRPVDRDRVALDLKPLATGTLDRSNVTSLIVATQTLEAGVDVDFDGLVTEAAPLDALRQRFGRLNRDGREISALGMIVADLKQRRGGKVVDPLYGEMVNRTIDALFPVGNETVDFGSLALGKLLEGRGFLGEKMLDLVPSKPDAPVLMPVYADLWSQTSPIPRCDPDISLFLHGIDREPSSVQVVWRSDVEKLIDRRKDQSLKELLSLVVPRPGEVLELPLKAARSWLRGYADEADLADVETGFPDSDDDERRVGRLAFRWAGKDNEDSKIVTPAELRPGDVIIVPCEYGGCDAFGWSPADEGPVRDVAQDAARPFDGSRFVVRIHEGLIRQEFFDDIGDRDLEVKTELFNTIIMPPFRGFLGRLRSGYGTYSALELIETIGRSLPIRLVEELRRFENHRGRLELPHFPYDDSNDVINGIVLVAPKGVDDLLGKKSTNSVREEAQGPSTGDDEAASFVGSRRQLAQHSKDVERKVSQFAAALGLDGGTARDCSIAAWLHDLGKSDIRFQSVLTGHPPHLLPFVSEHAVLAKSFSTRRDATAWARSGLPTGWRHEALSVRLALAHPQLTESCDRALVLWLIGTHHGLGRPFFEFRDILQNTDGDGDGEWPIMSVEGLTVRVPLNGFGPECPGFRIPMDGKFGPRRDLKPTGSDRDDDLRGADWHEIFSLLKNRYGVWGLALLETVVRLADHRASELSEACLSEGETHG